MNSLPFCVRAAPGLRFSCCRKKRREGESFDLLNESIFVLGDSSDVSARNLSLSACHNIELLRKLTDSETQKDVVQCMWWKFYSQTHNKIMDLAQATFFWHFITQQLDIKRYNKDGKSVPFYVRSRSFNMETSCYFCDVSKLRGKHISLLPDESAKDGECQTTVLKSSS
jgi:hypothetical protein